MIITVIANVQKEENEIINLKKVINHHQHFHNSHGCTHICEKRLQSTVSLKIFN